MEESFVEKRKKVKKELQIKKGELFEEWKKQWETQTGNNKLDTFFSLVCMVFERN